jgi:hypothetical protein
MENKINKIFTKKFNEIKKKFNTNIKYNIEFLDKDTLIFLNKNKKIIKAKYTFYGLLKKNQFIWATSMPLIKECYKTKIKKLKKDKTQIYDDYINNNTKLSYFFYTLLDNDMVMVSDENVPYINKLLLYLTDDIFIINPSNDNGDLQYIALTNICEIYV